MATDQSNVPPHIKRDVQKLAYDRTHDVINNIGDVFGRDTDILALSSAAAMNASFLMLYCATRIKHGDTFEPNDLLRIWQEAMQTEFLHMKRGFDLAQDVSTDDLERKKNGH